jgi:ABC-2 type transport system permease protein
VQLIILANAATFDIKNIKMFIVDKDKSATTLRLTNKFEGSAFFQITGHSTSIEEGHNQLKKGKSDILLHINDGFESDLMSERKADIQLLINGINSRSAGLINAYTNNVIADFNQNILIDNLNLAGEKQKQTKISYSFWFNPGLDYKNYMVPGILVILVTIIGMFLTALNIVREKELGTIEQINVTPIQKHQFVFGKLFPFWLIALFELAFGLFLGKALFDIPIEGSLITLFSFAAIYLIVILALGLFISVTSDSQQQVMFITFFFMLVFILMSGLFTPEDSMPLWAQKANVINPLAYFMRVNRMVLLKGSGFADISHEFTSMSIYAIAALTLAIWRYRKIK